MTDTWQGDEAALAIKAGEAFEDAVADAIERGHHDEAVLKRAAQLVAQGREIARG